MSLTSSLYAGTSGLSNTGNALQVTSNNIANINTLGFKKEPPPLQIPFTRPWAPMPVLLR